MAGQSDTSWMLERIRPLWRLCLPWPRGRGDCGPCVHVGPAAYAPFD